MTTLTKATLSKNNIEPISLDEVFTQIPNWTRYFLSNHGRLVHKNNKDKYKIVNPSITKNGYYSYTLSKPARTYKGKKVRDKNGKTKNERMCTLANRLVAMIYVNSQYPKEYTLDDLHSHHKDKNRKNNYYKNLMWLCKTKNGRTDHDFIDSIKKISFYNQNTTHFHTYKDIELLCKRLDTDIMELIDSIKFNDKLFQSQDGKWEVYQVNDAFIGVQFYKRRKIKK